MFLFLSLSLSQYVCVSECLCMCVCVLHTHTHMCMHTHKSTLLLHKNKMYEKWHNQLFEFEFEITKTNPVHIDESIGSLLKAKKKTSLKIKRLFLSGAKTQ